MSGRELARFLRQVRVTAQWERHRVIRMAGDERFFVSIRNRRTGETVELTAYEPLCTVLDFVDATRTLEKEQGA